MFKEKVDNLKTMNEKLKTFFCRIMVFILDDYKELESSFNINENDFREKLVKQYLISINKNYEINEKVVTNFRCSVFYFIIFLIIFLIMEVSL